MAERLLGELATEAAERLQDAQAERDRYKQQLTELREAVEAEVERQRDRAGEARLASERASNPKSAHFFNAERIALENCADRLQQILNLSGEGA